jgi:phosphoglycolate phosphatase
VSGACLAVFDCDGTLVDSQHVIHAAMCEAFARHDLTPPERAAVRAVVGLQLDVAIARLGPEIAPEAVAALADAYKAAFFALRARPDHREREPLFAGMAELVARLAGDGVVLGIATGKSLRGLRHTLAMHGLQAHFTTLQTPDTCPGKPHPGMVLEAMAATGARPEETVVVGDTSFDMEMACGAGAAALGVAWGYHPAEALTLAGASAVAADAAHLALLIDGALGRAGS